MKAALSATLLFVVACGGAGPVDVARSALEASAEAGEAADQVLAREYVRRSQEALKASSSFDEWEGRMTGMDTAVDALAGLRESLLAAEYALDAWERNENKSPWLSVVGCIGASLARVQRVFMEAGLSPPDAIADALEVLGDSGARMCGGKGLE